MAQMREWLEADLKEVDAEYARCSATARSLAKMPYRRELHELQRRYGEGLDTRSHDERVLHFSQARFVPAGQDFTCSTSLRRRSRLCANWRSSRC